MRIKLFLITVPRNKFYAGVYNRVWETERWPKDRKASIIVPLQNKWDLAQFKKCWMIKFKGASVKKKEEEEETLFDPKSTNVQITIPHISDIQFKQLCTHIYRHYVHKHSS